MVVVTSLVLVIVVVKSHGFGLKTLLYTMYQLKKGLGSRRELVVQSTHKVDRVLVTLSSFVISTDGLMVEGLCFDSLDVSGGPLMAMFPRSMWDLEVIRVRLVDSAPLPASLLCEMVPW